MEKYRESWIPVESSRMKAIDFDIPTRTLYIKFKDDSVYVYANVEPKVFEAFKAADSKGHFFNEYIKPAKETYPYKRLGVEKDEEEAAAV